MSLDIIYLIIATPVTIAAMYGVHCIKKANRQELPEAKPYEFEKDKFIPEFDEFSKAIYNHKFYKGKAK